MDVVVVVEKLWPVFAGVVAIGVGAVAWLIRLESKVLYLEQNEAHNNEKEKAIWQRFDAMQSTMNAVLQALSRLEGRLEGRRNINDEF